MFRLQEGFRFILSDNHSLYSILLYVDGCEIMVHVKQKMNLGILWLLQGVKLCEENVGYKCSFFYHIYSELSVVFVLKNKA